MFRVQCFKRLWQVGGDVGGRHGPWRKLPGGYVACLSMEPYSQAAGLLGSVALGEQRQDDARKYITASGGGHSAIAGGVDEACALRSAYGGAVSLYYYV